MLKILFLCTGNSCRSIMAEALLNHYAQQRCVALSAGSKPTGIIHGTSIATLKSYQIDTNGYRSKSWDEYKHEHLDIVITLCDSAKAEICPIFPGNPIKVHWDTPDPADFDGSQTQSAAEFDRVFALLEHHIKALLRFPIESMEADELAQILHTIGEAQPA